MGALIKGCLGKKQYGDLGVAHRAARKCKKMRGVALRVYRCPNCKQWHLTRNGAARAAERCGVCLEPFEPLGPDDWACVDCKGAKTKED